MGEYTHSLNSRFEIGRFRPFSLLIIAVTISAISAIFGNVALPFILPSIVTVFLWKYFGEDRKIRNIILIALWIKIIVSTIYYFYLSTKTFPYSQPVKAILFGGDGEMYSAHAWFVAILNTGKDMLKNNFVGTGGFYSDASIYQQLFLIDKFIPMDTYQVGFFTYLIAIIYSVFDYSPLLINFINCVLGVFSAVLIYKTTLLFFSKTAAKASLLLTLFFPTLFIWSSLTKLRDPLYAFMTILFLYLCVKIILQKKILKLLYLLPVMFFLEMLRKGSFYICLPIFILSLIFAIRIKLKLKFSLFVFSLFAIGISGIGHLLIGVAQRRIDSLISIHHGMVNSGGVAYRLLEDVYYTKPFRPADLGFLDHVVFYVKGMLHFWLEPFPNHWFLSKSLLIVFPQQILWYALLLFLFFGVIFSLRAMNPGIFILLAHILIMSSAMALSEANIGTMIRHRDMLIPICFVFSSSGLVNILGCNGLYASKKQGILQQ